MAETSLSIAVRLDIGIMPNIIKSLSEAIDPNTARLDRLISLDALRALCEIDRMAKDARASFGIPDPHYIGINFEVSRNG